MKKLSKKQMEYIKGGYTDKKKVKKDPESINESNGDLGNNYPD